ncbi:peptidase [Natrarchaeobius sp. A-rgal3]|uniref:peptidase n=1 Tax=Natrarchaeobius versutus TaxID=1679078 RepID=UPI0035106205
MSLPLTIALWIVLAVGVGIAAGIAAVVGHLSGRLARGWTDESAARAANVVTLGSAFVAGLVIWLVVGASADVESVISPESAVVAAVVAAVAGGVTAGVVGAAAITGFARPRPDLPGVGEPATVRRQYARYLSVLFLLVLLLVAALEPAIRAGPLAIGGVVAAVGVGLWVLGPFLLVVSSSTRAPTDAERERLKRVLGAAEFHPRSVRILEGGDEYVSVRLLGAPGGRTLFVSSGALEAVDDETVCAMVTTRRAQAAYYHPLAVVAVLVAVTVPAVATVTGDLPVPVGLAISAVFVLGGLWAIRRLRLAADDRAAERVGAEGLATAFERAADAAGFDLEGNPGRNWLSTAPAFSTRIERLRARSEAASDRE